MAGRGLCGGGFSCIFQGDQSLAARRPRTHSLSGDAFSVMPCALIHGLHIGWILQPLVLLWVRGCGALRICRVQQGSCAVRVKHYKCDKDLTT